MSHRIALVVASLGWIALTPLAPAADPAVIQIGLADSLVKDLTGGRSALVESEFEGLVRDFTGFKSDVHKGGDPAEAAKKLQTGAWHLGVFQGIEFAHARAKNPKLKPLMVAVNKPREIHALVVATKDGPAQVADDLKGKDVHLFLGKEHVRLFASKLANGNPKAFFGRVLTITSAEEAMDNLLRGKAAAAVVDNIAVEGYRRINPGRFERLHVLAKSELFPPSVIAYEPGQLSDKILTGFKAGMLKANESEKGREAMANFRLAAFETVPANFDALLADIVKAYPPK